MRHYLSLSDPKIPRPSSVILSDTSIRSLLSPTLPESALQSLLSMYNPYLSLEGDNRLKPGEANWSTAMAIYCPEDGRWRGGFGRRAGKPGYCRPLKLSHVRFTGSCGWGGAAGTEYFIDPETQIAVSAGNDITDDVVCIHHTDVAREMPICI
jgi:methyl acetate hydrolase